MEEQGKVGENAEFSIACTNVPDDLFEESAAIEHFGKFGIVTKMLLQPRKNSCVITYENRNAADKAVLNAGAYDGFEFNVKFNKKKRVSKKDEDPEWLPDSEVAAELAAMNAAPNVPRLNRQQKMELDVQSPVLTRRKLPLKKTLGKTVEKRKLKSGPSKLPSKAAPAIVHKPLDKDEVKQLFSKSWPTVEDKLSALEIKNRIFRTHLMKRQGAIKGCCPDMCPERERLMRQSQRQFSCFECYPFNSDSGTFDPKYAVKEYSRSSADQEEPLPNELRPVTVLKQTLLYLLRYIIDLSDSSQTSLADWFHFMWDRLRALRKDITQQALCCEGSLTVVESCARFHAHCASRLVEEPPSSFDQRLNTENLSKCLQSLKYMYSDLRNRNEFDVCKNESEFRAYVILLNLNDSNFMWEVKQLPRHVQSSPEVSFAIKVFTALDNNNYVNFFKLVKSTTYLNACILHRYFNDVRTRALQRMIKAYSPRGVSHFPAGDLMDILAFEDFESMQYFVELHGLEISMDQDVPLVSLHKNKFMNNVPIYTQKRAVSLVESKGTGSLGDIIFGSSLPPCDFDSYTPYSSFDKNNYFKRDAVINDDLCAMLPSEIVAEMESLIDNVDSEKPTKSVLTMEVNPTVKAPGPPVKFPLPNFITPEVKTEQNTFDNKSLFSAPVTKSEGFNIFGGTSFKPSANIFGANVTNQQNIFVPTATPGNIFGSVPSKPVTSAFQNSEHEIRKEQEERERIREEQEKKRRRDQELRLQEEKRLELEEMRRQQIENERRASELEKQRLLREKLESERQKRREVEREIDEYSKTVTPEIVNEIIEETCLSMIREEQKRLEVINESSQLMCHELIDELCSEEIKQGLESLLKLDEIRKRLLTRSVLRKWKAAVRKSHKRHILLYNTPQWIPSRSPPLPVSTQKTALKRMRDFHRGKLLEIKIPQAKVIQKIDVFETTKRSLLKRSQELDRRVFSLNIFWKVAISLPSRTESAKVNGMFKTWVSSAIKDKNIQSQHQLYLTNKIWYKNYHISLCKLDDECGAEINNKVLTGASGFLLYGYADQCDSILKRIENIILSKSELECLPIALILHSQKDAFAKIKERLIQYESHKLVSSYRIFLIDDFADECLSSNTKEALKWLSRNYPSKPPIEMNHLQTFLDQCLGRELWRRFRMALCSPVREAFRDVKTTVSLYNEAVDRTIQITCKSDLDKYPVFAQEFKQYLDSSSSVYPKDYEYFPAHWKAEIAPLEELLYSFKMPQYMDGWPPPDWSSFQASVSKFVVQLGWFRDCHETVLLKLLGMFTREYLETGQDERFESRYTPDSWMDVMECLVMEKIARQTSHGMVIYRKNDLNVYRSTPWWYRSPLVRDVCTFVRESDLTFLDDTLEDLGIGSKRARLDSSVESVPDEEWLSAVMEDMERSCQQIEKRNQLLSELKSTIASERNRQKQIDELLKSALEG